MSCIACSRHNKSKIQIAILMVHEHKKMRVEILSVVCLFVSRRMRSCCGMRVFGVWVGGWDTEALGICSSVALPCVGSLLLCLKQREKQLRMDGCSLQTRGQQPVGERKQREAESKTHLRGRTEESLHLAGLSEGVSWACREDGDQLRVLLHLSVAPQAAY